MNNSKKRDQNGLQYLLRISRFDRGIISGLLPVKLKEKKNQGNLWLALRKVTNFAKILWFGNVLAKNWFKRSGEGN